MSSGSTEEVLERKKYTLILEYTEERVIRRTTDENERVTKNNRISRQIRHQPYQSPNNSRVEETVTKGHNDDMSNDNNNNSIRCFRCKGPHWIRNCPKPAAICKLCGKKGHRINNCRDVPRGKKCQPPAQSRPQKVSRSGNDCDTSSSSIPLKCYRCEGPHRIRDCPHPIPTCDHCGKKGHLISNCWSTRHQGRSTHEKGNSSKVEDASQAECQDQNETI